MAGKLRYHLYLLLVCWIWGLAFIAMKVLLDELGYLSLNLARFLLTALFLAPVVAFYRRRRPALSCGEWFLVSAAGVAAVLGYHLAVTYGETLVPAGTAGLVANITPVFAALLSRFLLHESLGMWKAAGIALALGGVAVVTILGAGEELGLGRVQGILYVLLAALAWAVYTVLLKPLAEAHGAFFITSYAIFAGTLALLPLGVIARDLSSGMASLSRAGWGWLAFLSLGCTVLGYQLYSKGLEGLGASQASFYIYLVAPIALFWGWALLGEEVNAALLLGTAMILAGLACVGWEEAQGGTAPRMPRRYRNGPAA
ncbi:MAG: DMT family transporter [Actinobacteria bacterium]|nr:DMT family transporter [Actinomycetota bacterium]